MVVQHNMMAMMMARQMGIASRDTTKRMERLSSGYRINRAGDDAASLAISEKMRAQIRGLQKGSQNVQEAISFCNVAEGALNEVHDILGRIKELAVQAASDTYVFEDREAIEAEFDQLKDEINRISKTTEYNTMRIFDDGEFKIEFSDEFCPIKIFNEIKGNPEEPDTYGGIILPNDERVSWKAIAPEMVYTDPSTGKTMFKEGEYVYKSKEYKLTLVCEEGSRPPEIKVEFEVSAGREGLLVAGSKIAWENVVNEDGESILDHIGEEGWYRFQGREGDGYFYVEAGTTLGDIIDGVNKYNEKAHRWYFNVYDGYYAAQAVDTLDAGTRMQVSQDSYENCIKVDAVVDVDITLQADEDTIWAIDKNGDVLEGSKKTWTELGLEHWDATDDVSDQKKYSYEYRSPDSKLYIEFDFFLLDETSKESVIEGIHGIKVEPRSYITNNATDLAVTTAGTNIVKGNLGEVYNNISLKEEGEFGRNFDTQRMEFAEAQLTYDSTTNSFSAVFQSTAGTGETMTYNSSNVTGMKAFEDYEKLSKNFLCAKAVQQAMSSQGPFDTILDVLGAGKVTSNGYFSETYTTNANTVKTSGLKNGTFAAASIDFSDMGNSYQLYDLLGLGFDSTCMTCSNHYSIMFVYGGATETTADNGYGYSINKVGNDHYIQIDLKTMLEKGVTTGEEFTKALVEVLDEPGANFDYHFTQYATDDSGILYLCDNRSEYVGKEITKNADFYVKPYNLNEIKIDLTMQNAGDLQDARYFNISYQYDVFSEVVNDVSAQMKKDDVNGLYVADASGKWMLYDPADYYDSQGNLLPGASDPERFNIEIINNIDWDKTYDTVMQAIADNTKLSLKTTDYAFIGCNTEENPNEAYVSKFRFQPEEEEEGGMWIQAGPNRFQGMFLKWEGFSYHYLGLSFLSMTKREEASTLLQRVDNATEKISRIRSAFGAYTNRLEKVFDMNQIYEENLQAAESHIRDADMAKEMMAHTKSNILQQAAQAMLTQCMKNTEQVVQLLQ